jgi:fructokinase
VVDLYPDERVPAGSPLHTSAHLAAMGWDVHLVTRVGADEDGDRLTRLLEAHGVPTGLVERDPSRPTGTVTVDIRGLENRFVIHRPAAWDAIEGPAVLPPHEAFSFGTLVNRSPVSRSSLARLLAASDAEIKFLDMNLRPPDVARDGILASLRSATAVKVSESELVDAAAIVGIAPEPRVYFDSAPRLRWLCVTRGERGADLFERSGTRFHADAEPVEVTNTVGAGDAFTAGLIQGLATGLQGREALRLGQRRAASILAQRGGLPPPTR